MSNLVGSCLVRLRSFVWMRLYPACFPVRSINDSERYIHNCVKDFPLDSRVISPHWYEAQRTATGIVEAPCPKRVSLESRNCRELQVVPRQYIFAAVVVYSEPCP